VLLSTGAGTGNCSTTGLLQAFGSLIGMSLSNGFGSNGHITSAFSSSSSFLKKFYFGNKK